MLAMGEPASRRARLLHFNAGIWDGCFVRLDARGCEVERFASHLAVADREGMVHADLTNRNSGNVRSMQFAEPPAEMQISPEGHWSLGPDRIGAWSWVCELCLVWGERRRRIVARHNTTGLESLVLVCEARPGLSDQAPPAALQLSAQAVDQQRRQWTVANPVTIQVITMGNRSVGAAEGVRLDWQPEPGVTLCLERRYDAYGLLVPLTPIASR